MKVHVFGATSSSACALYALAETAKDHASIYSEDTIQTVMEGFYMDDCLKSISTFHHAIVLHEELTSLLKRGGFHLTKWLSNNKVLEHVACDERAKVVLDLAEFGSSCERILDIQLSMKDKTFTRRETLSVVSSLFDPLGFVAPVVLRAKLILQSLCRKGFGWDEEIPAEQIELWKQWLTELVELSKFKIDRCF